MQSFFIPHKLKVGDITNLSDKDSEFVISKKLFKVEDPLQIKTLESIFWARVTNIDKASVEVEIIEKIEDVKSKQNDFSITVVQSISPDSRFNFFLEKAVELGVSRIIPVESKYSNVSKNKAIKKIGMYKKILKEAKDQSRNPYDVEIERPINIKKLENIESENKICLATEVEGAKFLKDSLLERKPKSSYTIAIGPERGWSVSDIKVLKNLEFDFVKLEGNILRTETAGIVISSILNFKAGRY